MCQIVEDLVRRSACAGWCAVSCHIYGLTDVDVDLGDIGIHFGLEDVVIENRTGNREDRAE